ncbi:hypothetical protein CAFE_20650 [Caprobacter fermentans]|uniref:Uncharacterized protein n=1 Tax=Caproicibacter fermentans TaxID=2576756 RepID=A0A6N8HZS1_9FIRM|nr:hypothetical protein [Caproicibacter fermentans]MVB11351.1 hypothetical protein [Caproicibacter fermentans]
MQEKFDELNKILKSFAALKADFNTKIKSIEENSAYSVEGKRQLRRPIDAEFAPVVDETEKKVEQLLNEINEGITEQADNTDFLSDTQFTNALKMIELSHGELPIDVVDKINSQFSNSLNALKALQSVYKAQKCYPGNIEEIMTKRAQQVQQAQDKAYYTFLQGEPLQPLATDIAQYANDNGFTFNTDFISMDEM